MTPGQQWLARVPVLFAGLTVIEVLSPLQWDILAARQAMPSRPEEVAIAVHNGALRAYPFVVSIAVFAPVFSLSAWLWLGERLQQSAEAWSHLRTWVLATACCTIGGGALVWFLRTYTTEPRWTVPMVWVAVAAGWSYSAVLWLSMRVLHSPERRGPSASAIAFAGCLAYLLGAAPLTLAIPVWAWLHRGARAPVPA